jgi:hypothetical protein
MSLILWDKWGTPEGLTAIVTGLLLLVGFAQLLMFFHQLKLMRQATADAGTAARAASAAAHAARSSADALVAAERAHLFVQVHSREDAERQVGAAWTAPDATLLVNNGGKTPAILSATNFSARPFETQPTEFVVHSKASIPSGGIVIMAGKIQNFNVLFEVSSDEWIRVRNGEVSIYCLGIIEYEDVLGDAHETGFLWKFESSVNKFFLVRSNLNYRK